MIFQKSPKTILESDDMDVEEPSTSPSRDEVETVVGPSVNVEGDFASEGNIIVKGTVSGSVYTSRHLTVEPGAKIIANVRAGSATISGEVKGNMKIKDSLELTPTSKVLGDIEAKNLKIESGAVLYGRVTMPGLETEAKNARSSKTMSRRNEEVAASVL